MQVRLTFIDVVETNQPDSPTSSRTIEWAQCDTYQRLRDSRGVFDFAKATFFFVFDHRDSVTALSRNRIRKCIHLDTPQVNWHDQPRCVDLEPSRDRQYIGTKAIQNSNGNGKDAAEAMAIQVTETEASLKTRNNRDSRIVFTRTIPKRPKHGWAARINSIAPISPEQHGLFFKGFRHSTQ